METEIKGIAGPPCLLWDRLDCHAHFDYIQVWFKRKVPLPATTGTKKWNKLKHGQTGYTLTLQDPVRQDIETLVKSLDNPPLSAIQITVDLKPKEAMSDAVRDSLLLNTFRAVAGRFRPEDEALWGYGTRGGVSGEGQKPKPFHRRFPEPHEELVYGRKHDRAQATAYWKRTNERESLDPTKQSVRMEYTLWRAGLMELNLDRTSDLFGFKYQQIFARHFRIVSHPRVRAVNKRTEAELARLERRMWRGWDTAGVGKFAISPELPTDTIHRYARQIQARSRQQLPLTDYVLVRDTEATKNVGNAFKQLQRRLALKKTRSV